MSQEIHITVPDPERDSYRRVWRTNVRASVLLDRAQKVHDHHLERIRHWVPEVEKAEAEYRESVQVREHEVTGGKQHHVTADAEKANHLSDVKARLLNHREQLRNWKVVIDFLENAGGDTMLPCTVSDLRDFALPLGSEDE